LPEIGKDGPVSEGRITLQKEIENQLKFTLSKLTSANIRSRL